MEISSESRVFDFSDPKQRKGQRLMKGGPWDVYATASSDARKDRCEEKERKESSDPDAPAESEQDLSSHISVVGLVLFTTSVSSSFIPSGLVQPLERGSALRERRWLITRYYALLRVISCNRRLYFSLQP